MTLKPMYDLNEFFGESRRLFAGFQRLPLRDRTVPVLFESFENVDPETFIALMHHTVLLHESDREKLYEYLMGLTRLPLDWWREAQRLAYTILEEATEDDWAIPLSEYVSELLHVEDDLVQPYEMSIQLPERYLLIRCAERYYRQREKATFAPWYWNKPVWFIPSDHGEEVQRKLAHSIYYERYNLPDMVQGMCMWEDGSEFQRRAVPLPYYPENLLEFPDPRDQASVMMDMFDMHEKLFPSLRVYRVSDMPINPATFTTFQLTVYLDNLSDEYAFLKRGHACDAGLTPF